MDENKLNNLVKKVEYCLDHFVETRNSDITLFATLCENFYPPFREPIYTWRQIAYTLYTVPSMDHIARARRKVIEKHKYTKYLPTDRKIALARLLNEAVWKDYMVRHGYTDKTSN